MAEENKDKKVTCPDCGHDVDEDKIEEGRCPDCKYNIQLDRDLARIEERKKKEAAAAAKNAPKTKRRGIF